MKEQTNTEKVSHYEATTYGWALQEQLLLVPHYLKIIGNVQNKDVLDLGCGNGWLTKLIAKNAKSVFGCDISESMIEIAKKEHSLFNIVYQAIDAVKIGQLQKKFDIIVCSLMLHASQNKRSMIETLKAAHNLLKENGTMVILVPHPCFSTQNKRKYNTYTFPKSFNYFQKNETYNVKLVSDKGITEFTNKFYNLQDYFDAFQESRFLVSQVVEPTVVEDYLSKKDLWTTELEMPFYIIFKIVKGGNKNE